VASKSPFSKRVYDEWLLLLDHDRKLVPSEREARILALYNSCLVDGSWNVSIDDAALVTLQASTAALQGQRYPEAMEICARYFLHPDEKKRGDYVYRVSFGTRVGVAAVLTGKVEEGVASLAQTLNRIKAPLVWHRLEMRDDLEAMCSSLGEDQLVDPLIGEFLVRYYVGWPEQAPRAQLIEKSKTYREAMKVLYETGRSML